ncbi:GtrA family protein [Acinetobacter equi]|uniref:Uncharacterized protein n=1 Tax=Acinetobacter equi TaxID=1324350 RepID=A0A0N9VVG7_9GAMM|nr:GtrA family protein [Acinetobacter equi]ALH95126.1 hypothetical protein AOY20_05985 [Acinetobacter equi]
MINVFKLTTLYFCFALIATILNILAQQIMVYVYWGKFQILISLIFGTIVGLLVKYFLDKKYIFKYKVFSFNDDARLFALYSLMGVFTTFIFWGFEFLFYYMFENRSMRYIGAVIGLFIGYIIKYFLDKKYVFRI